MRRLLILLLLVLTVHASAQDRLIVRYANERSFFIIPTPNPHRDLREYLKRWDVLYAEIDRRVKPDFLPNDPLLGNEWHIAKIAAPTAWDKSIGAGVIIAVADTGCDTTHIDLSRFVPGWNFFDGNTDTREVYLHGSSTAGTALAVGNNTTGVAGVAWGATLMPLRISGTDGYATVSRGALAIRWAADNGARVVNISYEMTTSTAVQDAARYAYSKGVVVCISSGNSGLTLTAPNPHEILTVGSTGAGDAISSWSNRGSTVDLYAPGENILTTQRGGTYGYHSGTSFSSPVVAGVAALCFAAHPQWNAEDCIYAITSSCDLVNGVARVNAAGAVAVVIEHITDPPPPPDTTAPVCAITAPTNGTVLSAKGNPTLTVNVAATDNVGVAKVDLYVDGVLTDTKTSEPWSFTLQTKRWAKGAHSLIVRAFDAASNIGVSLPVGVTK